MENEPSKFSFDLKLRVSHAGFGVSEAYIVHAALGDYVQKMLPYLVQYHREAAKHDEYDDAIHALSVIESALNLQEEVFMKLLSMAEANAYPDSKLNFERNQQREAEQQAKYRDLFKIAMPKKGGEQ